MDLQELLNKGPEEEGKQGKGQSPLVSLKKDLDFYKESIQEVSSEMMAEGYTLYPIFVAHQLTVDLGEMILDRDELNTQWSIQASSLEEFVERGIIKEDKKEFFEKNFKPANDFMCLFVVVPEGANFVFYPYNN
ncbi:MULTISPECIES: hypothetical protein [Sphingobacterium]|uniref:Uncharacterized protein n=1 Tax=Sphingobacterium cellulitidis TaxID=1768011 RepID=A0A8H9G3L5_9SPHI|nr:MULTISPECIES: hypothetical protein [Sphingobacterium]MBA8987442.1 hypothetical protein [Sphingobacterium soli]WFB63169.1 hypothetical protein PZ892_16030 [Sphingobacterium sp. WM]GGE24796.1 hypothetical protein GCM10011516_23060 [Sphingobacterium soli]